MTSTDTNKMGPFSQDAASREREIGIEEELLRDLGFRYRQYRQALSGPFDPVRALFLTGRVLEAVDRILTSAHDTLGPCLTRSGRYRK